MNKFLEILEMLAFFGGLTYAGKVLAHLLAVIVVAYKAYTENGFSAMIEFLRLVTNTVVGV